MQVPKSIRSLQQVLEDRAALHASYKRVFSTPDGERILRHLMKESGILNPKIVTDTNLLLVRQGQQHIVLSVLRLVGKDANELINQIKESLKNED